ncbi:HNH endonuclease [Lysinibacillus sp. CD3-6]|uniref:HNH endonuclease signature motif containing protein n=1 Tax=Lysinibacillus sp. CD3-6 TaxID=2892541 RepID=UPI001166C58D|nr:HNH endonuclease signature motif containing protein [Lysinibacillus sp. CD3-6]UED78404.1 HNH endonuclease [Lysinibacillus sp. CD3-6]
MRVDFSSTVKRDLQIIAGNHCMICSTPTTKPRIAHIIPAAENGPRSEYRKHYSEEFIASSKNGLSLCNTCHDLIDDEDLNTYTIQELFNINNSFREKFLLEEEYKRQLGINNQENYIELEEFYKNLITKLEVTDEEIEIVIEKHTDFKKIDYLKKIEINKFNIRQKRKIKSLYAAELFVLKENLEENPIIAIKLKAAIQILYNRLSKKSKNQEEIYDKMLEHMYDPSKQVLGNEIILTYYFVICEVFLK